MTEKLKLHDYRMEYWKEIGFQAKTALDIGACLGQWTKSVTRVWPECVVTQVEADPRCEQILRPQGYELHMSVLSDTVKDTIFYTTDNEDLNNLGNSSVYLEATDVYREIGYKENHVKTQTLDLLFPGRQFDFVKIDTQGSELDILRGGRDLISHTSLLQLELSFLQFNHGAPLFSECISVLKNEFNFSALDVFQVHYMRSPNVSKPNCIQIDLLFGRHAV